MRVKCRPIQSVVGNPVYRLPAQPAHLPERAVWQSLTLAPMRSTHNAQKRSQHCAP